MKDKLINSTLPLRTFLSRERTIVLIILSSLCIGYVFYSTNKSMLLPRRDEARFQEGLKNLKNFKFDDNAITQLRELKSESDTSVAPSITNNRVNPFIQ